MRSILRPILAPAILLASGAVQAQNAELTAPPDAKPLPIVAAEKEKDQLLRLLDDAKSLARWMANEPSYVAAVDQVREQITAAEALELAPLREFEPHFSHLEVTLARMRARMSSVQADTELCDPSRRSDLFLLFLDTLDADGQREVNTRICEKLAAADGTSDRPASVCVATQLAFSAARAMKDLVLLCDPTLERAKADGSAERFEQLRSDLAGVKVGVQDSVRSAKRDLTQAMSVVAGHVAEVSATNTTTLQGTLLADRDLTLRLEIEKALRTGQLYAAIYLPEAYGGQLEFARQIAVEAIQNVAASGEYQEGASAKVSAGDEEYTNQRFRKAFGLYSEAYRAAVGSPAGEKP